VDKGGNMNWFQRLLKFIIQMFNGDFSNKEEVIEHGLIMNKDIVEDLPGQIFMWNNLFLDES